MTTSQSPAPGSLDVRTQAVRSIAWLIVVNKPIYPIYVWYLTGEGVAMSCLSVLSGLAFLAVALLAPRAPLAARIAFPLVALVDTLAETKLFGAASGTELYAAPAALIAALSFYAWEARWPRGLILVLYVGLLALHGRTGAPLFAWSEAGLDHLRELNIFAVASLTVFVVWRFSGLTDPPPPTALNQTEARPHAP
jgi:hypothetical protein